MRNVSTNVLVIGGGATGAGTVRDLAMQGVDSILVEKSDLPHGTTGRYHGLLHSGGRYAVRDPVSACECIEENRILPFAIEDTGGYFATTPSDDPAFGDRFLAACRDCGIPAEEISIDRKLREEPRLNPHMQRGFRYAEAAPDAFLATHANARSAREHGAKIWTNHQVVEFEQRDGRVVPAIVENLLSNGEFAAAERYARSNIDALYPYARMGLPIISTSTSCTLTLKEEAPELVDPYDEASQLVARQSYNFCEVLRDRYEEGALELNLQAVPGRLLYHPPCQLRAHRIGTPALELLRLVPELEIVESRADCCGIAGTYGLKREQCELAMAVGEPLFRQVEEVDGEILLCDNETCRWQIEHAPGRRAQHPITVLARAFGLQFAHKDQARTLRI